MPLSSSAACTPSPGAWEKNSIPSRMFLRSSSLEASEIRASQMTRLPNVNDIAVPKSPGSMSYPPVLRTRTITMLIRSSRSAYRLRQPAWVPRVVRVGRAGGVVAQRDRVQADLGVVEHPVVDPCGAG